MKKSVLFLLGLSFLCCCGLVYSMADGVVIVSGGTTTQGTISSANLDTLQNCFPNALTNNDTRGWTNTVNIQSATLNTTGTATFAKTDDSIKVGVGANQNTKAIAAIGSSTGMGFANNHITVVSGGSSAFDFDNNQNFLGYSDSFMGFSSSAGGSGYPAAKNVYWQPSGAGNLLLSTNLIARGIIIATNGIATYKNNAAAPTSISVTASEFLYTNTQSVNIQVFLDANGATTSVKMNGSAIFTSLVAGDHTIILQPQDYIGVTYSVATPIMKYREF